MNKYYITSRLIPAILTSIPACTAYYYFLAPLISTNTSHIYWLHPVENIGLMTGIIFLVMQINRYISKEVFEKKYFKNESEMPTTNYLMDSNTYYTSEIKRAIRSKIKRDFEIDLLSQQQDSSNELTVRKNITMAVSQVRSFLKENSMIYRHNMEYGFFRNLIGGCVPALIISLIMALMFKVVQINETMFWISLGLSVIYFVPISLSKTIINKYGSYYAKILFEQYLETRKVS